MGNQTSSKSENISVKTDEGKTNVYILRCENDKYYVGKSKNPEIRTANHFNNGGSAWTRLYKPLKILDIIPNCDDFDEDKYTKKYMAKYGIDNVRGGTYCQIDLDETTRNYLTKEINASQDKCHNCGKLGHFIKNCPMKSNWVCMYCDTEFATKEEVASHVKNCSDKLKCDLCKRTGHIEEHCFAKTDIDGNRIKTVFVCEFCEIEFDLEDDAQRHLGKCKKDPNNKCDRCGRSGHNKNKCYAKTDASGNYF